MHAELRAFRPRERAAARAAGGASQKARCSVPTTSRTSDRAEGIEYALSLTPGFDQPVSAEAGELLRNRWLTQAEHILDLAH